MEALRGIFVHMMGSKSFRESMTLTFELSVAQGTFLLQYNVKNSAFQQFKNYIQGVEHVVLTSRWLSKSVAMCLKKKKKIAWNSTFSYESNIEKIKSRPKWIDVRNYSQHYTHPYAGELFLVKT